MSYRVNNIAFDLDGCIVNFISHVSTLVTQRYDVLVPEQQQHDFVTVPELTHKQVSNCFVEAYCHPYDTPIYDGAEEMLHRLYEITGQPPLIITARPHEAATHTHILMERVCKKIPFMIAFSKGHQQKHKFMNGIDFLLEDRRATAKHIVNIKYPKRVLLVDKPYNQMDPVVGVSRIPDIRVIVENIGMHQFTKLERTKP